MSVYNVNNVSVMHMIPNEVMDIIIEYRMSYLQKLKYKKCSMIYLIIIFYN